MAKFLSNNRVSRYFVEAYQELRKVVWPTADTVRKHTLLVIGISVFVGIYFAILDFVFNYSVEKLLS